MSNLRRQTIVIAVLIALIGCVGYFARKFNENTPNTFKTDNSKETASFFIDGRMGRENQRSSLKQELEDILNSKEANKEAKQIAQTKLFKLQDISNKENTIETKAKERGFEDALCFVDEMGVELVVKTSEELTKDKIAQLTDDIVSTTGISPSNIIIKAQQ